MKKAFTLLLATLFFSSCIDDCQICTVVIEDNYVAADYACLGLPSPYPAGYEVFLEYTQEYCGQELDDLYLREGEVFEPFCPGVIASQITYVICE